MASAHADPTSILVTGATGTHGGAVARALLDAGHTVRALTRDPSSGKARRLVELGAEPVAGDLEDADALAEAIADTPVVYAVTTPFGAGADAEVAQGEGIIAAARKVGLPWLILASVASADRGTGVPHFESKRRIEQRLSASQVPHTIVAPTFFYENLGSPAKLLADGKIALPLSADRPLQQIALADLGSVVAAIVNRRDAVLGRRIEIAADQPTPREMVDALSHAAGRPVAFESIAIDDVAGADLQAMYRFLETTGYQVDIEALRAEFPEVAWTAYAEWARAA